MARDLAKSKELNVLSFEAYGESLTSRFMSRLLNNSRAGRFGNLSSRNHQMLRNFEVLSSILDQFEIPVLVFGEKGTGKQKIVEEFYGLQSFCLRLSDHYNHRIFNFRGLHLDPEHIKTFNSIYGLGDVIVVEGTERLSVDSQQAFLKIINSGDLKCRLVFLTSVALSMRVASGTFSREFFSEISQAAVYLPSLVERAEDIPSLVLEFFSELKGPRFLPAASLMDILSRADMPRNLDDLKILLQSLLYKNPDPRTWTIHDFPQAFRLLLPQSLFESDESLQKKRMQKNIIQRALIESGGSVDNTAKALGVEKAKLLQSMLMLGIR